MRTGLSFARGSCRALKWMAPWGVAFALGAGSASAQVTISGADDRTTGDEGESVAFTVTLKYTQAVGAAAANVVVGGSVAAGTGTDVVTVGAPGALTVAEAADFTATLTPVTIVVPAGPATGTAAGTGTVTGQIYLNTSSDEDAEDEKVEVTFTVTNASNVDGQDGNDLAAPSDATRSVRIMDDEEQTFKWVTPTGAANTSPREGRAAIRTLTADPAPTNLIWSVALAMNEAGYTLSSGTASLDSAGSGQAAITITPPSNDGNREADTIELRAFLSGTTSGLPGLDEPLEVTFADVHALPAADKITAKAYEDREGDAVGRTTTEAKSVTEGGEPVHVRVTIDRGTNGYPMGEKLIVRPQPVDPAQRADYRIEPNSIEVPTGNGKRHADFVLYARPDDDVGAETLELNLVTTGEKAANGPGEVVGTFSIDVVDATTALVAPAAQAAAEAAVMEAMGGGPLNPGDSFTLDTNDLFNWAPAAVDAAFAASVRGAAASARVSGETVTVEAKEAGDAAVTVTATGTARGSSAVGTSQTVANTASVTFDVQVVLADLAITLSGPENVNVVEGGQPARVTATANRAVTKDTTVRLSATGGDAVPGDYSVGNVVIEAGDDEGSTLLTATADDEAERSETLTLRGVFVDDESGEDGQTVNSLTFNLWDAAVPALPVVAQLLLAAFLAVGGYRRYLRRR